MRLSVYQGDMCSKIVLYEPEQKESENKEQCSSVTYTKTKILNEDDRTEKSANNCCKIN